MNDKERLERVFPAVFRWEEGQYSVIFPDLGCATCGETLEEAFLMASDLLNCWLDGQEPPKATPLNKVKSKRKDVVLLVQPVPYLSADAKSCHIQMAIEDGLEKKNMSMEQAFQTLGKDEDYFTRLINLTEIPTQDEAKKIAELLDFDWKLFFLNDRGEM